MFVGRELVVPEGLDRGEQPRRTRPLTARAARPVGRTRLPVSRFAPPGTISRSRHRGGAAGPIDPRGRGGRRVTGDGYQRLAEGVRSLRTGGGTSTQRAHPHGARGIHRPRSPRHS